MGILRVDEMLGARAGSVDAQWRRTYKRAFRVITDGPMGVGALGARLAIPVFFGQTYEIPGVEFDLFAFALAINAQIDPECNDDSAWVVTVDYGPYDATQFPENPLNHPVKISWGENRFEKVCFQDRKGKPVLNSAGDYFDPPLAIDDSRPTLRIVRNEQTYDPGYALLWKDCLNSDTFWGFAPGMVKMSFPLGELEFSPFVGFYYVITYQFEINPAGWKRHVLDQGMRQIVAGVKQKLVDDKGEDVDAPALLDGKGKKLKTGSDPVYLDFEVYNEADFSALRLDPYAAPGQ